MTGEPFVLAVCGEKHTGKTTLVERLVAALSARGLRVATVKHDGHEFAADVAGTDSYRHRAAGAGSDKTRHTMTKRAKRCAFLSQSGSVWYASPRMPIQMTEGQNSGARKLARF